MDFSSLILGRVRSLAQVVHIILTSVPVLITVNASPPQGCFFFIISLSPTENFISSIVLSVVAVERVILGRLLLFLRSVGTSFKFAIRLANKALKPYHGTENKCV